MAAPAQPPTVGKLRIIVSGITGVNLKNALSEEYSVEWLSGAQRIQERRYRTADFRDESAFHLIEPFPDLRCVLKVRVSTEGALQTSTSIVDLGHYDLFLDFARAQQPYQRKFWADLVGGTAACVSEGGAKVELTVSFAPRVQRRSMTKTTLVAARDELHPERPAQTAAGVGGGHVGYVVVVGDEEPAVPARPPLPRPAPAARQPSEIAEVDEAEALLQQTLGLGRPPAKLRTGTAAFVNRVVEAVEFT